MGQLVPDYRTAVLRIASPPPNAQFDERARLRWIAARSTLDPIWSNQSIGAGRPARYVRLIRAIVRPSNNIPGATRWRASGSTLSSGLR